VSGATVDDACADTVVVEFPSAEGYRGVGRLVLGGIASRFDIPVDRVEEMLLAVESLLLHGVVGETVTLEVEANDEGLVVRVGPLADGGFADPSVARIVSQLVDGATELAADGRGGAFAELVVAATRQRQAR
jgi:hypothetical protein